MKCDILKVQTNAQHKALKAAEGCGLMAYVVTMDLPGMPPALVVARDHDHAMAEAINAHHKRFGSWVTARRVYRLRRTE